MTDDLPLFSWGVRSGAPIAIPGGSAVPRAFHAVVRLPRAAFVWNTPLGIDLQRGETSARVPAVDITRLALLGMAVLTILTGTVALRRMIQKEIER